MRAASAEKIEEGRYPEISDVTRVPRLSGTVDDVYISILQNCNTTFSPSVINVAPPTIQKFPNNKSTTNKN
jgi:hypothetical protein